MGSNNSVPANYNAATYAVLTLDIVLTTAAVTGRTVSQKLMKVTPVVDDYLCYFAFTVNLGLLVSGLLLTAFGKVDFEKEATQNDDWQLVWATVISFAFLYVFAITSIKLSILFLYRRIFTMIDAWFRWCWWILLNLVMLWAAISIILVALESAEKMPESGFLGFGISTGIINALFDMLLLVLPVVMVARMKLQKKQRIALIFVFGIGVIASILSLIRGTIFIINNDHRLSDVRSNYLEIALCATESSAGLMCVCLPLTEPIINCFIRWLQRLRGLDTDDLGWTTLSSPTKDMEKGNDRTIMRVVDYDIQLRPMSKTMNPQASPQDRETMAVEKPWQSIGPYETRAYCESNATREQGR